jgi:transposase
LIEDFPGCLFDHGQEGRLTSAAYIPCLTRVLAHTTQHLRRIQDGAKYHTSAETNAFFAQQTARRQVLQLPTYAPDDHPLEPLWKKIKQHDTHVHYFPTFEELTEKVEQALLKCAKAPAEVLALCRLPTALAKAA